MAGSRYSRSFAVAAFALSRLICAPILAEASPGASPATSLAASTSASTGAGASADWLAQTRRQVAEAEYEVTWQERPVVPALAPSWHAPNRAHGFRTYFTEVGPRVIPRVDDQVSWQWGLRLIGIGRGQVLLPVQSAVPAVPASGANRIAYDRGAVVEWYVNDSRGLEQGVTLSVPPEEHRDWPGRAEPAEALALVFLLEGELAPIVSGDGQAIDFVTPAGVRVLRYAKLSVTDAAGRMVPARMEGRSEDGVRTIRIVIEDSDAVWPLTVDPLLTSPAWTAESDQGNAAFGFAAATAGDVNGDGYGDVIVSAHQFDNGQSDEGRAYVYHGSASGLSSTPAWTAEANQAAAFFGYSAATAGDVNGDGFSDVIVGAIGFSNGQSSEGRAYVYHGSASGLSGSPAWTAESDQANAGFGSATGTAGDVNGDGYADVLVGAESFSNGEASEGRVFVYHGSASGLSVAPSWTAESNQAGASFGSAAATAGDVNGDGFSDVIVGALLFDNGQNNEGRAFVYHGSASGLSLTAAWTAESDQLGARFGYAVATAGDVNGDGFSDVIAGAPTFDNGQTDEGRAFLYLGGASGLSPTAAWTAESDQGFAQLGSSVGTAGDVNGDGYADVLVGAPLFDADQIDEGRASLYYGSAAGPGVAPGWTVDGDQTGAFFGGTLGTAGDVDGDGFSDVVVGASLFDNGQADEGRASVYRGSASGLATAAGWTTDGGQADGQHGVSVASAGDVNGDGFSDVIVGACLFDNGQTDEGRAFVYHGAATGLSPTPSWTAEGDQAGSQFGVSVATAGDVNGDGFADVIVGAYLFDGPDFNEGRATVYLGSASGLSPAAAWSAESNQAGAELGGAVGTAGDVNGDGYADVIVGAPSFDGADANEGRAFVYHGSASGLSTAPAWTATHAVPGGFSNFRFGDSVGTAGDVNGDGFSDVIVGAGTYAYVFVYHGSVLGLSSTASWAEIAGTTGATAGDVNGDGFSDVIVGFFAVSNGFFQEGTASVYHGSASGLLQAPSWVVAGGQQSAWLGLSVGPAGDVNGDGYSDVVVGAPKFSNGQGQEGRALVYHGSVSGLSLTPAFTAESDQAFAFFGWSVAAAGDVNGDGYGDVLVGAPLFNASLSDEGRAFLYYGNGGAGRSLLPQQRRSDDAAPITPLGASDRQDGFRLAAFGRSPFGRGLAKIEWEVKPLGIPLDGSGVEASPAWTDAGVAGAALSEIVPALPGTTYHWRLRLRYHPATTPFLSHSRWLSLPANGWQEADLKTPARTDLAVSQVDDDPVLVGSNLVYTVSVTNQGPDGASAVLTDTLPAGASFTSAVPSRGSCEPPVAGTLFCALGRLEPGEDASVVVTLVAQSAGTSTNTASVGFAGPGIDPTPSNNTSVEPTTVRLPAIGDRVWADSNGNGLQDPGEPGIEDVLVTLHDGGGTLLQGTLTDGLGSYRFSGLTLGSAYRVRFWPQDGYTLAPKDQGGDDLLDSDPSPSTHLTPVFVLASGQDPLRWDAGFVPDVPECQPPDEPIFISAMSLSTDGNDYPILHYQDPNQPSQVTGYNVRRSSNGALPPGSWPLVASDVIDMDEATPNKQWVDTSGAVPPGGIWYYQVTAFNSRCPAEGPF